MSPDPCRLFQQFLKYTLTLSSMHMSPLPDDGPHIVLHKYHIPGSQILNAKLTNCLLLGQGKGFHLVRGFPVEQFKADRVGLVLAFWSLALHLGRTLVRD